MVDKIKRTTGTSNSYRSRQPLDSGLIMSISLKTNCLLSQTCDNTDLACTHKPQFSRVKRVILHDCSNRLVARIFASIVWSWLVRSVTPNWPEGDTLDP